MADGLQHLVGDDVELIVHPRYALERVHEQRRGGTQKVAGLARDHPPVGQHHGAGRASRSLLLQQRRRTGRRQVLVDAGLVHEKLDLFQGLLAGAGALDLLGGLEVAADDLVVARIAAGLVVGDGHARHVHAHIRGRLVRARPRDALHSGPQHGEDLHVAVVVHRGLAIGLQVEGIDDVVVVQIGRGRLIGDVHRVRERQIPNGEGLVLGVAGADPALVLVVELGEAGGHLARAGAGRGHHHKWPLGLDVVVLAEALVGHDMVDVIGIAGNGIMQVARDAHGRQPLAEQVGVGLVRVAGDDDRAHRKSHGTEDIHEAQHVLVVGDAQITAHLRALDVVGVDGDDDLRLVLHGLQHGDLRVGLEAGQHAGGMVVVEELAAEFEVELAAELVDALANALRLQFDVLVVVESFAHRATLLRMNGTAAAPPQTGTGNRQRR